MKIYWEYNGHPYGNVEEIKELMQEESDSFLEKYEDLIEQLENQDYYMIMYKSGGKWYMYNSSIIKFSYQWKIEM